MKKVVICVSMQDERETLELQKLKESDILNGREVHFLTVFKVGRHINELSPFNFQVINNLMTSKVQLSMFKKELQKKFSEKRS